MRDVSRPQTPRLESASGQTFRFGGVELKSDDDAHDKVREQVLRRVKIELWVNSIGAMLVGSIPLFLERWLATTGLVDLPSPYPYWSRGLLLFYIGWAMYWGIRDAVNATALDKHHPLDGFISGVMNLHWMIGGYGLRFVLCGVVLISYNLLGGGIYGFYKLVQHSRYDLAEVGPNKSVAKPS